MILGLNQEENEIVSRTVVNPLKQAGCAVWVFGSRARGDFKAYSDIDLLYLPKSPLTAGTISKIKEEVEESRLPYNVDLVSLNDLAASYRQNVLKDRREL